MKRMLTIAFVMVMLLFVLYAHPQDTRSGSEDRRFRTVSLIRLIANRGDCDGEYVRVIGYLAGTGLDMDVGVFVSDSDGRNGVLPNAVGLDVSGSTIQGMIGKYVMVSGLYHAPVPEGQFNGHIDHIFEVKPLRSGNTSK